MATLMRSLMCILAALAGGAMPVIGGTYTVTLGSVVETMPSPGEPADATFSLFGPNFSLTGSGGNSEPPCLFPGSCPQGSTWSTDLISSEDRGVSGTLTLSGTPYPFTALPGLGLTADLNFTYTVTIPVTTASSVTLNFPFTLGGTIGGDPTVLPDTSFDGTGTGTLVLRQRFPGASDFTFQSATYTFGAIPEPGTFILSAIALASLLLFVRRSKPAS